MNRKNLFLLLKYDIKNVIIIHWKYFIAEIFLCIFVFFCFLLNLRNNTINNLGEINFGIVDIVLTFFIGNKPLNGDIHNQINLSIPWITFHALQLFLTGFYAYEDLSKKSQVYLIRVKSKKVWLISKSIWCFFSVCIYYMIFFLIAFLFVLCYGNIKFLYNEVLLISFFKLDFLNINHIDLLISIFIKPIIVSWFFSEIEMILSLFFKPIYVYISFFSYIIISACYCSPLLIYNYSIVCRITSLASFKTSWMFVVFVMTIIMIFVFIFGIFKIQKKDVM